MKFRELPKEAQDFLIDSFETHIETTALYEGVNNYKLPTREEYADFFDDFEEDMAINEVGLAVSTIPEEHHNTYTVTFDENDKVILEVHPPHEYDDEDYYEIYE